MIYFIEAISTNRVKIGTTKRLSQRLAASSLLRKGLVTRTPIDLHDDRGRRQCELILTEEGASVARTIGGKL